MKQALEKYILPELVQPENITSINERLLSKLESSLADSTQEKVIVQKELFKRVIKESNDQFTYLLLDKLNKSEISVNNAVNVILEIWQPRSATEVRVFVSQLRENQQDTLSQIVGIRYLQKRLKRAMKSV